MQAANRIHFLIDNYSYLQGLKAVPIGLSVIAITWLDNRAPEGVRDVGLPLLLLAVALLAYGVIGLFYSRTYGHIRRTFAQRFPEILMGIAAAVASYLAFWFDPQFASIGSTLGVTVAVLFLLEYLRTSRRVQGKYSGFLAVLAAVLFLLSILPILGWKQWWLALHFQSQSHAILMAMGIIIVLTGVWGHLTLLRLLRESEVTSESSI